MVPSGRLAEHILYTPSQFNSFKYGDSIVNIYKHARKQNIRGFLAKRKQMELDRWTKKLKIKLPEDR